MHTGRFSTFTYKLSWLFVQRLETHTEWCYVQIHSNMHTHTLSKQLPFVLRVNIVVKVGKATCGKLETWQMLQ